VYVFFLGWKQSGTYVNHRPSKEKLNTLNTSRECEVESLKVMKRSNPQIRQGDT
jgi:hypothetical protein